MSRRHEDRKPTRPAGRKSAGSKPGSRPTGGKKPVGKKLVGKKPASKKPALARTRSAPRTSQRRRQGLLVTPARPSIKATNDGKVRLNQFLAQCGVCSRRAADDLIATGRIEINGKMVKELGTRVDPVGDEVRFDGRNVRPEKPVYVLFNKPKGVVCTNARHEQKKRVIDFMPTVKGRLFTVGRLDLDSEGLILLTNDGPFALEMTHPSYGVPKLYHIVLRGHVEQADLTTARGGVWLAEGPTSGMRLRITRTTQDRTYIKVILREGKNREIRRVFAKLGFPVISLKRVRIGELTLRGLRSGHWRFLERSEVKELRRIATSDELMTEGNR